MRFLTKIFQFRRFIHYFLYVRPKKFNVITFKLKFSINLEFMDFLFNLPTRTKNIAKNDVNYFLECNFRIS